jgi:hypothetical protein
MTPLQAFLLGVMVAYTPSMIWLAVSLIQKGRTDHWELDAR